MSVCEVFAQILNWILAILAHIWVDLNHHIVALGVFLESLARMVFVLIVLHI